MAPVLPSPRGIVNEAQAHRVIASFRCYLGAPGWRMMEVKEFWSSLCHDYVNDCDRDVTIPEYRRQMMQDLRDIANSCVPSCNLSDIDSQIFDAMYAGTCFVSRGQKNIVVHSPDAFVETMESLLQELSSVRLPDFQDTFGFSKDFVKSIGNGRIVDYVDLALGMAILTSEAHESQKATALQVPSLFTLRDRVALLVQDDALVKLGPVNFSLILDIVVSASSSLEYHKAIVRRLKCVLGKDWKTLAYASSPGMTVSHLMEMNLQKGTQDPTSEMKDLRKRFEACGDVSDRRKWARDVARFMVRQYKYWGIKIHATSHIK